MQHRQKRTVEEVVLDGTAERGTVLVVEVYYTKGGMCYATFKDKPRGYYVSVGKIKRDFTPGGFCSESFGIFSHLAAFLEPAKMFSAKHLASISPPESVVGPLREKVLAQDGEPSRKTVDVP